jgi:hypothetical protein
LKDYDSGSISQELAAEYLGITPRCFRHIYKIYKSTGSVSAIGVNLGRPKKGSSWRMEGNCQAGQVVVLKFPSLNTLNI